jgi:FkbM family methyltransferase
MCATIESCPNGITRSSRAQLTKLFLDKPLAACPGVTVFSFEPNPALYAQHITTKTRNQLARFFPFNLGLSDTTDSLTLHMIAGDSGASTFGPHPSSMSQANAMKSQVTSFDEWVQKMNLSIPPTPTWVAKIDVEGYEVKVLRGMKEALQARAFKGVCIEVNQFTLKFCDETSQTLYTLMETLGYQAYDERGQRTGPQRDEFRNVFFRPM